MVFSSVVFLLYFLPAFLITYYVVGRKYKNFVILLFSILFYSWGAPKFIFAIVGSTLLGFFLVKKMHQMEKPSRKKFLLVLTIILHLGLLFYFKYANFFIDNINALLTLFGSSPVQWTKIVLPIGISFFTFEAITYVVDVYRGVHRPLERFWDYLLYILFFPKLIAGPIIRYHDLADQIRDRSQNETIDNRLTGFYRFCIGLAKKVLIANQVGGWADFIFALNYASLDSYLAWMGILAYTFQIYFDFSGYSDMAIGIAKMVGFTFPENFNNPYISGSITEFWRRWHISLGSWMKNYLYIPLGGNRVSSKRRLYFNLWIVFLASGLWHGASWTFVFWGAYHGLFLVLERGFLLKIYQKIGRLASTVITFILVTIGWVFFRVEKISDAFLYIKRMFAFDFHCTSSLDKEFYTFFCLATLFAFFAYFKKGQQWQDAFYFKNYNLKKHIAVAIASSLLLILCISFITASGFNPFIYFRF